MSTHQPDPAMDVEAMDFTRRLAVRNECDGGIEAHDAHMEINGDCPWCGAYDRRRWAK